MSAKPTEQKQTGWTFNMESLAPSQSVGGSTGNYVRMPDGSVINISGINLAESEQSSK